MQPNGDLKKSMGKISQGDIFNQVTQDFPYKCCIETAMKITH